MNHHFSRFTEINGGSVSCLHTSRFLDALDIALGVIELRAHGTEKRLCTCFHNMSELVWFQRYLFQRLELTLLYLVDNFRWDG